MEYCSAFQYKIALSGWGLCLRSIVMSQSRLHCINCIFLLALVVFVCHLHDMGVQNCQILIMTFL